MPRTPAEQLDAWKAVTGHVMAVVLTLGFFGIVFLALIGKVNLTDPTTATFIGTVTGYAIGQLSKPLAFYFYIPRDRPPSSASNGSPVEPL